MEVNTTHSHFHFFLLFLIFSVHSFAQSSIGAKQEEEEIQRSDFPPGFLFGVSTSSYQIEGAYLEDGKGLNNWDVFSRIKGSILNGDNGYICQDHYHRYLEDIEILHSLGVDAYRLSISWARVLPRGRFGEVNPKGIEFYDKIIDNLLLKGIEPFVTIHHFEYPQELVDRYGAWLSSLMQEDYIHFAELCFKSFGDRVKHWFTINEPNLFSYMAYEMGMYPPARCSVPFGNCSIGNSDVEPLISMHNMLLAHGKASKLYREHFKGGVIGIVVYIIMLEPLTDDKLDQEAATRGLAFDLAWALDPLIFGDYPSEMHCYHGRELPRFSSEETKCINGSIDFIGVNHYSTLYAKDCTQSDCPSGGDRAIKGFVYTTGERDGVPIGDPTAMENFYVVPRGMGKVINYLKRRYHNKPMYVTENGYASSKQGVEDALHDVKRIEYHKAYLASLAQAIRNGADVRGYFPWTLMDDFEWVHGYDVRLGLYHVEPKTQNRIPKLSGEWYKQFLSNSSLEDKEGTHEGSSHGIENVKMFESMDEKAQK